MAAPSVEMEQFGDGFSWLIKDPELIKTFRAEINSCWNLKPSFSHFPGAMPVTITRDKMRTVLTRKDLDYYVTKKSNGLRYTLIFTSTNNYQQQYQILMNRKTEMRLVKFEAPLSFHDGTIIDGELLKDTDNTWVFEAFEVVFSNGRSTCAYRLSDRLEILKHLVDEIKPCPDSRESPFKIRIKKFAPLKNIEQYIKDEKLEYLFSDRKSLGTGLGTGLSDGLIFIPNLRHIVAGVDTFQFKLKPQHLNTIDVQIRLAGRNMELYITDKDGLSLFRTQDTKETLSNFKGKAEDLHGKIVECVLCPETKLWKPLQIRKDKISPNYIAVVQDAVKNIEENIKLEEIIFAARE